MLEPLDIYASVDLDLRLFSPPADGATLEGPAADARLEVSRPLCFSLRHAQFMAVLALAEMLARMARRHRFRCVGRPTRSPADAPPWRRPAWPPAETG